MKILACLFFIFLCNFAVCARAQSGKQLVKSLQKAAEKSVGAARVAAGSEVQHAMVAIRTTGGVLENTGRCQVHISGFLEAEPESHDSDDRTDSDTSKSSSG